MKSNNQQQISNQEMRKEKKKLLNPVSSAAHSNKSLAIKVDGVNGKILRRFMSADSAGRQKSIACIPFIHIINIPLVIK